RKARARSPSAPPLGLGKPALEVAPAIGEDREIQAAEVFMALPHRLAPHGLVEVAGGIGGEHADHGAPIALGGQLLEKAGEQAPADPAVLPIEIDVKAIDFALEAEALPPRGATGAEAHQAAFGGAEGDEGAALAMAGDGFAPPGAALLQRETDQVVLRQQPGIAGAPGLDLDARHLAPIHRRGLADLEGAAAPFF